MVLISILTPAIETFEKVTKEQISSYIGTKSFKLYKLVAVTSFEESDEIVIKADTNFSL